jgi:hypothetical protein
MFRISGPQPSSADAIPAKSTNARGSNQNAKRTGTDTSGGSVIEPGKDQAGTAIAGSFASELQVWDPFTGRYYAEGQAPKVVLHTVGGTPQLSSTPNSRPEQSFTTQGIPDAIRLDAPSPDAAIFNSARSVTASNAIYNQNASDAYDYQVQNWKDNNGRRWLNGQFVQTEIPPPPPILKETVFEKVLDRIKSGQVSTTPIPYYMGNAHAGQIYEYNAPLSYEGGNTTTSDVSANGQAVGGVVVTPQGQQFASNIKSSASKPNNG